jgi:ferredoxin
MRVSILTFSLTGNTKLVAKRIGRKLSEVGKHTVTFFNLVKVGKEIDSLGADHSPRLSQLRSSLETSEVVGLGAFSNFVHPSWRVNELFAEDILPAQYFRKMECFFTFATAGQIVGRTINVLSTLLAEKNSSSVFLGSFSAIAPENGINLLPLKGYRDTWRTSEFARIEQFGDKLVRHLDGSERIVGATFSRAQSWEWAVRRQSRVRKSNIEPPVIVREKCQRCATCERKCPYNAISLNPDIEDGFPVVDRTKCEGCGRCLNLCPSEAIEMPKNHTELRSRYPKANTVPAGERCADGALSIDFPQGPALMRRALIGRETTIVTRVAITVLVLGLIFGWILRKT